MYTLRVSSVIKGSATYQNKREKTLKEIDVTRLQSVANQLASQHEFISEFVGPLDLWFKKIYEFRYKGAEVLYSDAASIKGHYLYEIDINQSLLSSLRNVIKIVSAKNISANTIEYGYFANSSAYIIMGKSPVHPSLLSALPGVITADINAGGGTRRLFFILDFIFTSTRPDRSDSFELSKDTTDRSTVFFANKNLFLTYKTSADVSDCPVYPIEGALDNPFKVSSKGRYCGLSALRSEHGAGSLSGVTVRVPFDAKIATFDENPTLDIVFRSLPYASTHHRQASH